MFDEMIRTRKYEGQSPHTQHNECRDLYNKTIDFALLKDARGKLSLGKSTSRSPYPGLEKSKIEFKFQ